MRLSDTQLAVITAVVTFVTMLFYSPHFESSQVITRVGLTMSIIEQGSLTIDRMAEDTVDKSLVNGHYYADKAPGISLLAVPPVFIAKVIRDLAGAKDDSTTPAVFIMYAQVATLAVIVAPASIAAALIFLMAIHLGANRQGALVASFAIAIGSPFFFWSTTFFAHSLVGSMLVFMLALADDRERWDWPRGLAIGLLAGLLVVVDFVGGLVAAVAGLVLAIAIWRPAIAAHRRFALGVIIAAAVGVAPLLIYNYLAFGSPFQLGYMTVVGFEGMKTGFFGIGMPDPWIIVELLFGGYRGLLPYVPVLILVPYGLWAMSRERQNRPVVFTVIAVALVLILVNAGYYYWGGGWSTGPRHIVPMLPLLGLPLAFAWPGARWQRTISLALVGWGILMAALVSSSWMFADEDTRDPLISIYWSQAQDPKTWFNMSLMLPAIVAFILLYRSAGRQADV